MPPTATLPPLRAAAHPRLPRGLSHGRPNDGGKPAG
jgi:hypothetical protein